MVRSFFERIIEWDWPDAPARNPVIAGDIPKKPDPLPKFLDDRDAAKFMTAARSSRDPRDRLVVELLARTGMRVGELVNLEADAVVQIGANHWLRIPLGKLRNDRYVPLHPQLVDLLADWTAANLEHIRAHRRLVADRRGPVNRHSISRIIHRSGRLAGVPGVHPHRLRHTPATQAINRGMRLEAIAALLGHKKMEMTLIDARIANRVVADEYAAVSAKIDALYGQQPDYPPTTKPPAWPGSAAKPRPACSATGSTPAPSNSTAGWNRPAKTCAYFRTSVQFLPTLTRQRRPRSTAWTDPTGRAVRRAHPTPRPAQRTKLITCPSSRLDLGDAIELAELLTFLTDRLSGSHQQPLADSLAAYVGHDRYNIDELRNYLHRFVFLLGLNDGEQPFGEPTP